MVLRIAIAAAAAAMLAFPVFAQNSVMVPGQPAPVPLPPAPVVIAPQPPGSPPRVDTFSDKVSRCVHFGGVQGLPPGSRDAYTRACVNN